MKRQLRYLVILLSLFLFLSVALTADNAKPGKPVKPARLPKGAYIKGEKPAKAGAVQAGAKAADRVLDAKEVEAYEAQEADRVEKQHEYVDYIEAAQGIYDAPSDDSPASLDQDLEDQIAALDDVYPHLPAYIAAANALGYIHLLLITSRSYNYLVELMQILAFACFPTLPLIQFANNLCRTAHAMWTGRGSGFMYFFASVSGTYAVPRSSGAAAFAPWAQRRRLHQWADGQVEADISEPTGKFVFALFAIIMQIGVGVVGVVMYASNPTRSDWDVAPIAQDQRQGWTALSGLVTSALSFVAFMCSTTWRVVPAAAEKDRSGRDVALIWEGEVFTEIVLAALVQDLAIAYVGGANSLIGMLTFFMANRIVLIGVFLAVVLVGRYLRRLARMSGGPKRRFGPMRPLFIAFTVFICGFIVVLQIMSAVGERFDLGEISDYVPERRAQP